MTNNPSAQLAREKEILSYFLRNPQAADSLEGIARWRLTEEIVYRTVEETRQALAQLVQDGLLTLTTLAGVTPIYRLDKNKLAEAQSLFSEPEQAKSVSTEDTSCQ